MNATTMRSDNDAWTNPPLSRKTEREMACECKPTDPDPVPGFGDFGHIKLSKVSNARDLGGLPAADGRKIKRRKLVRSSELHDATAADMSQLTDMHNVDCIIDFRTAGEMERTPDPLPLMDGIKYMHMPVFTSEAIGITSGGSFWKDIRVMMDYAGKPYEMIEEMYPKCVLGEPGKKAYSAFLDDLLHETKGATLWHCTQGKDRTGIGAMLVEHALGVPMEYIRADYLATNLFVGGWAETIRTLLDNKPIGKALDNVVEAYAYANLCYLDTALASIGNSYGSLDRYMSEALDFGKDKQMRLRELYLE